MRIGLGQLRFPPDVFWRMTLPELITGSDGFAITQGNDPDLAPFMSWEETLALEDECRKAGLIT